MGKEVAKPPILSDEQIEGIVRRTFPLFELDEEDEKGRKATINALLKAQQDVDIAHYAHSEQ